MYKSDINFNLYKTFYDVATYGSISKAAVVISENVLIKTHFICRTVHL